jgi:hypothetical protein
LRENPNPNLHQNPKFPRRTKKSEMCDFELDPLIPSLEAIKTNSQCLRNLGVLLGPKAPVFEHL